MLASLLDHLYENASLESEIAFIHRPRLRRKTWTYAELARTSFRFARELETRGIGRGDRVLLWAENSPEWVAAFYGIILRGAGIGELWVSAAVLIVMGCGSTLLAARLFVKQGAI